MKSVTVEVGKEQLDRVFREMSPGDAVVLTDGTRRITLESMPPDDIDDDEQLEKELLKAVDGPFADFSFSELDAIAERVLAEKKMK